MKKLETIEIYTDGSCKGNPGPGGWCAIVLDKITNRPQLCCGPSHQVPEGLSIKPVAVLQGHEKYTTNNRMEMVAVIEGLRYIVTNKLSAAGAENIVLYSDSKLVVQTLMKGWKRKANLDLWEELDKLNEKPGVDFLWIKGHASHYWNNECDKIAQKEARLAQRKQL